MLSNLVNDSRLNVAHAACMATITQIHQAKQGRRPHNVADWAELRGFSQSDIAREIGADKSIVSRWFNGATPSIHWQERLAALFHTDRDGLFRHPTEDWMKRFLQGRPDEDLQRIKSTLEAAFPRKTA